MSTRKPSAAIGVSDAQLPWLGSLSLTPSIGADADQKTDPNTRPVSWVLRPNDGIPRGYEESDSARAFSIAYDTRPVSEVVNPKMRTLVRTKFPNIREEDLVFTVIIGQLPKYDDRMTISSYVRTLVAARFTENAQNDIKEQLDAATAARPREVHEESDFESKWKQIGYAEVDFEHNCSPDRSTYTMVWAFDGTLLTKIDLTIAAPFVPPVAKVKFMKSDGKKTERRYERTTSGTDYALYRKPPYNRRWRTITIQTATGDPRMPFLERTVEEAYTVEQRRKAKDNFILRERVEEPEDPMRARAAWERQEREFSAYRNSRLYRRAAYRTYDSEDGRITESYGFEHMVQDIENPDYFFPMHMMQNLEERFDTLPGDLRETSHFVGTLVPGYLRDPVGPDADMSDAATDAADANVQNLFGDDSDSEEDPDAADASVQNLFG
tara:strand:+ start:627 stop:1940 length:1314 start_codon:yes stop_codon:yes gene_type:complete